MTKIKSAKAVECGDMDDYKSVDLFSNLYRDTARISPSSPLITTPTDDTELVFGGVPARYKSAVRLLAAFD